jgi:hypothetical protein
LRPTEAGDRCHLDQWEGSVLRIAQQVPGEPGDEGDAEELQGDPEAGRHDHIKGTRTEQAQGKQGAESRPVEGKVSTSPRRIRPPRGQGSPR